MSSPVPESDALGRRSEGWRGPSSIAAGCSSCVLLHVTGTVASYSLLRKTVDQFSHGSAGWQGLVTERTAHQPRLKLAFKETAGGAQPSVRWSHTRRCGEGSAHPGKQKGNVDSLFSAHPRPCYQHQMPRGYISF